MRASHLWSLLTTQAKVGWDEYKSAQVFVPLIFKGELQGILVLGKRIIGDVYSDQDLSIIATVAEQGVLALVNVLLFEKQRRLAQQLVRLAEEERKRLASDLHDTVLQDLFFIKQGLHNDATNPELVDNLEETIQNLRRSIKNQRPPLLDNGISLALQGLVEDMRKIAGPKTAISWVTNIKVAMDLNDEKATAFFRIAQEALNNAVKHACANHIAVSLEQDRHKTIRLKVSDNGNGSPWIQSDRQLNHTHFGLVLMHERAAMIDARLIISSLPGEGTSIELEATL
jgi:signal transduction histidine kinase